MIQQMKQLLRRDSHPELPLDPDAAQPGRYKWPPYFTPTFILVVFVGGCAGTVARYGISVAMPTAGDWPTGILCINLSGALLLGMLLEGLSRLGPDEGARRIVRLAAGTGFLGAFTTYSTFAVGAVTLLANGESASAVGYMIATVGGGLLCSMLGIWLAATHHAQRAR